MGELRRGERGNGRTSGASLPRALRDGLLVTDMGDEMVVYDAKRHRGHCLNRSAAVIWRHLDGQLSMDDLVAVLRRELDGPADEDMVWLALKDLEGAHLLETPLELPASRDLSRRSLLRRLSVAAGTGVVLLPAISSIVAPTAHAQVSATACPVPDTCATFSCAGGCACMPTTEGATVCIQPTCVAACTTTADCPPGSVCFTGGCCGPATFCVPICVIGAPDRNGPAWQHQS